MQYSLSHLTYALLFSSSAGFFVTLGFVRHDRVGARYFLYHGLGTAALAALGYYFLGEHSFGYDFGLAFAIFLLSIAVYSFLATRSRLARVLSYGFGLGAAAYLALAEVWHLLPQGSPQFPHPSYFLGNLVLSSLVLGFTLAAMILGHWYLIEPKLPIEELRRLTAIMIGLLGIRFLFGLYSGYALLSELSELEIYRYLAGSSSGIFILMRWVWGILGPLFLSYFIWKTVQMRSTQSATGILYVAVVFVLAGEIISQYLAFYHGIPT